MASPTFLRNNYEQLLGEPYGGEATVVLRNGTTESIRHGSWQLDYHFYKPSPVEIGRPVTRRAVRRGTYLVQGELEGIIL